MKHYFLILIFLFSVNLSFSQEETTKEKIIIDVAEVDPQYPGGEESMTKFIRENFNYPKTSMKNNEHGTIYAQFVVNSDGSISDLKVIKGVSPALDNEVIRVIKAMPNWIPGMVNGENVNVRYVVPVKCILSDTNEKTKSKKQKRKHKRD